MGGRGSGGANALTIAEHQQRNTYRPDRHGHLKPAPDPPRLVSQADRRRTLDGLSPTARRLANALLSNYADWDPAALVTLRLYVESVDRVRAASDDTERRRETRIMLGLLKALELDR